MHQVRSRIKPRNTIEYPAKSQKIQSLKILNTDHKKSKLQLKELTDKPIFVAPFWINQNLFFDIPEKEVVQEKLGINTNDFLIGSFQRDTEGSNMTSPKLSKGPDRFIEIVQHSKYKNKN